MNAPKRKGPGRPGHPGGGPPRGLHAVGPNRVKLDHSEGHMAGFGEEEPPVPLADSAPPKGHAHKEAGHKEAGHKEPGHKAHGSHSPGGKSPTGRPQAAKTGKGAKPGRGQPSRPVEDQPGPFSHEPNPLAGAKAGRAKGSAKEETAQHGWRTSHGRLFAPTPSGLEQVQAEQAIQLGFTGVQEASGGIFFKGGEREALLANLWFRYASRVLFQLAEFDCTSENDVYQGAAQFAWEGWMGLEHTFAVRARLGRTGFNHAPFLALKIKDGLADRFRERTGQRPSVDTVQPSLQIEGYFHQGRATLYLDATGDPLFKRGWRGGAGEAPMKEHLAAGLVALTGWNRQEPFYDLFSGSGTLSIEAALLAGNRAPNLARRAFACEGWQGADHPLAAKLRQEARAAAQPVSALIVGYDADPGMAVLARQNAKRAGVADAVQFETLPFERFTPPQPDGLILVNPPYGERLESDLPLQPMYKRLGDLFKQRCQGMRAFVFTRSGPLAHAVGLRTAWRKILFNGPLECRLLAYELYASGPKKPV